LVLLAALAMAFGPAASVQVAAWTSMLLVRSVESGVVEGARSTFSGRAPCRLCSVAESLRRDGQDADRRDRGSAALSLTKKSDGVPVRIEMPMVAAALDAMPRAPSRLGGLMDWAPKPLVPPPRA
jgi:hypothetical protein